MSEEDVLLAKARTHNEYVECRARLGVLESEARRNVELLERGLCILAKWRETGAVRNGRTGGHAVW